MSTGRLPARPPRSLPGRLPASLPGSQPRRAASTVPRRCEKCETLVHDATEIRVMLHDVEKVSGETMTETMTNGRKKKKRDTTHRRIALQVAPPGLEPGLS